MGYQEAVARVTAIREEVVCLVGICGRGTHPLTDILDGLYAGTIEPARAVQEAEMVGNSVSDFR